jgi:hypothetical protein
MMLRILSILIAISLLFTNCEHAVYTSAPDYHSQAPTKATIGFEVFYNELGPYGRWMDYPGEGYVWVPNVEQGFRPYASNGHWIYSDLGWTWSSNYQWGWAAFHYGRWMYEDDYGWIWVPGNEWAPAWVTWGQSSGYYGWAPLAPHISINMSVGGGWIPPAHYWNFVPQQHITQVNINNYVINNTNNTTVVNNISKNITYINNNSNNRVSNNNQVRNANSNVIYNTGPHVKEVESRTNNSIYPMVVHETQKPNMIHPNEEHRMDMYRPQVARPNVNLPVQSRPAPNKVERYQPPANHNSNPQNRNNRADRRNN